MWRWAQEIEGALNVRMYEAGVGGGVVNGNREIVFGEVWQVDTRH